MSRPLIIAMHVLALPLTLLASTLLTAAIPGASAEAVDLALDDTYVVVAHLHASSVLASTVAVASVVAYASGGINWLLRASWAFLLLHLATVLVPWVVMGSAPLLPPSEPRLAFLSFASVLGGLLVTIGALVASATNALRGARSAAVRAVQLLQPCVWATWGSAHRAQRSREGARARGAGDGSDAPANRDRARTGGRYAPGVL